MASKWDVNFKLQRDGKGPAPFSSKLLFLPLQVYAALLPRYAQLEQRILAQPQGLPE